MSGFAVIDLETTGFACNARDRIREIAVVLVDPLARRQQCDPSRVAIGQRARARSLATSFVSADALCTRHLARRFRLGAGVIRPATIVGIMTCSQCGFEGHNSRTCDGPHWPCPNCGKPTANMNDYLERHDADYCSPFTSPSCWG